MSGYADRAISLRSGPVGTMLAAAFLVTALFWFAWVQYPIVLFLLGLLIWVTFRRSDSHRDEDNDLAMRWGAIRQNRWRLMLFLLFVFGIAGFALLRAVNLAQGDPFPHAQTSLERWGALPFTAALPYAFLIDGVRHRGPRLVRTRAIGIATALCASLLGLTWKDAFAVTFAILALNVAFAGIGNRKVAG